jgi:molybdopterin converting factor small subunit
VKVTFYGSLAEAIGREVELEPRDGATVGDVRRMLFDRYPEATASLARGDVMGCIDDEIVGDQAVVAGGKELAFLPLLSGG